ncbi:hypothetical protein ABPG72_007313 [Tetrahymena utriculariae]
MSHNIQRDKDYQYQFSFEFQEFINSYSPPLPSNFEQQLTTFLLQQYQLEQLTIPSIHQQLLTNNENIQTLDNNIGSLQSTQQNLQLQISKTITIIEQQSNSIQQLQQSLKQQQEINEQQTSQITELFNSVQSIRQSNNDNTTQILQKSQQIDQLYIQGQQTRFQLENKIAEFNQQFITHQSSINHLQQDQDLIKETIQQEQQQLIQVSHVQDLLGSNIQDIHNQILQLKNQIELIPISPIDLSQITNLLSTKLDISQFSRFSQDYSITIQQLDDNIQNLLQESSQTKASISSINDQLFQIDKVIEDIQNSVDIELIYNLKTQL